VILELGLAYVGWRYWRQREEKRQAGAEATVVPAPPPAAAPPQSPPAEAVPAASAGDDDLDRFMNRAWILLGTTTVGAVASPTLMAVSIPFLLWQTRPVFEQAYAEVTERNKVGGAVIRAMSTYGLLLGGAYWVSAMGAVIFGATERLTRKVTAESRHGLRNVFGDLPRQVVTLRDGTETAVAIEDVQAGDIVVVRAGQAMPVDGVITAGSAAIDQQALTGESQPAEKGPGDSVFAATTVLSGRLEVRVDKAGADTLVAGIEQILERTASYTSQQEFKGKQIADRTVLPTLAISGGTLLAMGVQPGICMLALYPGEGMRVLGPLSMLNYVQHAAAMKILVKDGRALESLNDVDTVVFDKTGTLTEKDFKVVHVHPAGGESIDTVLGHAAAVEAHQSHPIALAIAQEASARLLSLPYVDHASYEIGFGISAEVRQQRVHVGSARYLDRHGIGVPDSLIDLEDAATGSGHSFVYVAIGGRVAGAIELAPKLREEIKPLLAQLKARGLQIYILSGDREAPTRRLAEDLGVDRYFAGTLPHQKAELIAEWQAAGKSVCFVGDGINDAIALKKAHVSISLAGASTIATDSAQIVFMEPNLDKLVPLFQIAKDLQFDMRNNLIALVAPSPVVLAGVWFFGFGYMTTAVLVGVSSVAGIINAAFPAATRRVFNLGPGEAPAPPRATEPEQTPASPVFAEGFEALVEPEKVTH
jgi:heavy metal translocating P-type ATPase